LVSVAAVPLSLAFVPALLQAPTAVIAPASISMRKLFGVIPRPPKVQEGAEPITIATVTHVNLDSNAALCHLHRP
jgi:hypothetical protein